MWKVLENTVYVTVKLYWNRFILVCWMYVLLHNHIKEAETFFWKRKYTASVKMMNGP